MLVSCAQILCKACGECAFSNIAARVRLRLASTVDPLDGRAYLSPASGHYLNLFGDAPWELCDRESNEDSVSFFAKFPLTMAFSPWRGLSGHAQGSEPQFTAAG